MVRMCFNYHRSGEYNDVVDELNILHTSDTIEDLTIFLSKHPKQRINFCISDLDAFLEEEWITALSKMEQKDNLVIRLKKRANEPINGTVQSELEEAAIPFYYTEVATDWDVFNGLIDQGVSDVYVGNILGFELDKVAAAAHQRGVSVRVFPNIAQSAWNGTNPVVNFFIRPEDLIFYSDYVDCFELFELGNKSITDPNTLYDVYKYDKQWFGDLRGIILYLKQPIENRALDDQWARSRVKCGKSCAKGGNCRICYKLVEMSENMTQKEIELNRFLSKKV